MSEKSIDKKDLIQRIAKRKGQPANSIEPLVEAVFEEIYQELKREESVSVRNFGTFYIDSRRSSTVFKFNPAQSVKALFGWSNTYKGEL